MEPVPGGRLLVVWREDNQVFHRTLEPLEVQALAQVASSETTFGSMCDLVCEAVDEEPAAQVAFQLLRRWAVDGLLRAMGKVMQACLEIDRRPDAPEE